MVGKTLKNYSRYAIVDLATRSKKINCSTHCKRLAKKQIVFKNKDQSRINNLIDLLDKTNDVDLIQTIMKEDFTDFTIQTCKDMFSYKSKDGWKIFKAVTSLSKRQPIVKSIQVGDQKYTGDEMSKNLIEDYKTNHESQASHPSNEFMDFASLALTTEDILKYSKKLSHKQSANSIDCIDHQSFKFCCKIDDISACIKCSNRLSNISQIFES